MPALAETNCPNPALYSVQRITSPNHHANMTSNWTRTLVIHASLALTTLASLGGSVGAKAAPGDLDTGFGAQSGFTRTASTSSLPASRGMLRDSSGRFWVASFVPAGNNQSQPQLMRYLSNGLLDTGFANAGIWTPSNSLSASLADARVLRSGNTFYLVTSSNSAINVFALDSFGTPISSFGNNGRITLAVNSAYGLVGAVMQGSQIVIAGNGKNPGNQNSDFLLIRLLGNGSLDSSFGSGGLAWSRIYTGITAFNRLTDLVMQPDAKLVAVGRAGPNASNSEAVVARFLAGNGAPDTSFNGTGFQEVSWGGVDRGREVALQSDGKVVFAGTRCDADGASNCQIRVTRLNSNGSLDTTYASNGTFAGSYNYGSLLTDLIIDSSNRAVGAGSMTMGDGSLLGMLIRLQSNGSPDSTFGGVGVRRYNFTNYNGPYHHSFGAVMLDSNGIVMSGVATNASWSPSAYWVIARVQP